MRGPDRALLDEATSLIQMVGTQASEGMRPCYPGEGSSFLGLVREPIGSVLCAVAVAPARESVVFVSFQADPLYCPGSFYLVQPIERVDGVKVPHGRVRLPEIDVSPKEIDHSVETLTQITGRSFESFCSRFGSPGQLTRWDRHEPDPDAMEAAAFSYLEMGQYELGGRVFRSIVDLSPLEVGLDSREGLAVVQPRAADMLDLLSRPDAIKALLQSTRKAKLARYGI